MKYGTKKMQRRAIEILKSYDTIDLSFKIAIG